MTTEDFTRAARAEAKRKFPAMNPDSTRLSRPRAALRDGKWAAFLLGAKWARVYLTEQEPYGPRMSPLGIPVGAEGVQEVWDAFVKPSQSDDAPPQSIEMRELMAILRWAYIVLNAEDSAARAARRDEEKR